VSPTKKKSKDKGAGFVDRISPWHSSSSQCGNSSSGGFAGRI